MKKKLFILFVIICSSLETFSQVGSEDINNPSSTPPLPIELVKKNESFPQTKVSSERRRQAYAKLLEGQRYLWESRRVGRQFAANKRRLAKKALLKAVELDPQLTEGYTALADLEWYSESGNLNNILIFSEIAIKLDKNSFGGHRYSAIIYTIRSRINTRTPNLEIVEKAIFSWREVGRLDPRNAMAWAVLSAFYEFRKQTDKKIDALKKWLSSNAPLYMEKVDYARMMRRNDDLSPKAAAVKLGETLLSAGRNKEALKVLTRAVSNSPGNAKAIALLIRTLEITDTKSLSSTIEALRQAVFVNPYKRSLVESLARTIAKTGQIDEAIRVLRNAVDKSTERNKFLASNLQVAIGDMFAEYERTDEAILAYQKALSIRGIEGGKRFKDDSKDFARRVLNKMVLVLKKSNRADEAETLLKNYLPIFSSEEN